MSLLLVTNDDGIHAAGLSALAEALAELGEVWVIAPEREQSACGHALTLHRPLRAVPMGERRFAVSARVTRGGPALLSIINTETAPRPRTAR